MSPVSNQASRRALLLSAVFVLGLALVAPNQSVAGSHDATSAASSDARELFRLLNQERVSHGLRPLRHSAALDDAARWQSHDMVARGYFEHERPGGPSLTRRIRRTGYLNGARSWAIGENIAWGEGTLSTPANIMDAWMRSPGHRANILNRRFEHVGIGLEEGIPEGGHGSQDGVTATTDFGARS